MEVVNFRTFSNIYHEEVTSKRVSLFLEPDEQLNPKKKVFESIQVIRETNFDFFILASSYQYWCGPAPYPSHAQGCSATWVRGCSPTQRS
jgi:hypothetical protein